MKTWIVGMVLVVLCSTCFAGWETTPGATWDTSEAADANSPPEITIDPYWSIEAGGALGSDGSSKFLFSAMFWPDYKNDGGIGVIGLGDDTADGEQSLIAGPGAEFPAGPIMTATLDTVLPDGIASAFSNLAALMRPYARAAFLFDEDAKGSPLLGTSFHIFPNSAVQIIPRTDWIHPQGRAKEMLGDGFLTSINAAWFF